MTLKKKQMPWHICFILSLSIWQMMGTFAQDSIDHYKIADQLYEDNLRDSAIWHINKTIAQASSQADDSLLILGLTLKCQIYMAVRTLDEANSIINEALPIADILPTSQRHLAWMSYRQKAQMMNSMFRFDSTIFYLEAAQASIPGPDDNPGFSHSLYAWAYVNKREYDKAIIHSKRSYELYSTHADSQSVSLIIPLQCLQASYNYSSQFDSALIYAKIYQQLVAKHYTPNHPNIGIAHNDLGTIYQNLRRYPDALYHRKKCEDIFYHDYLENKQTRLISHAWHNLGYLYNQMGDNHLAYNYLEKAFKLNEQDYGRENLTHINTLLHLGHIKTNNKEYHSGEILIRRALAMQKKLGPGDFGALNLIQGNLASNLYLQSRFLQSDSLFIQLSKYYTQTGSFYTKQMLGVHDGWGHSWALRHDHRQAMKHFKIALSIADSIYPPLNLETIRIFGKMARSSAFVSEVDSKIYQEKILRILASSPNDSANIRFAIPNAVIPELAITQLIILRQKQQKDVSIRSELLQLIDDYMFYVARHLGMFSSDISIQDFSSINKQIFIKASELLLNESRSKEDLYTTFRWGDAFRSLTLKLQANGIVDSPQSGKIPHWQSLEDSLVAQLRTARVTYHQSPTHDVEALRELAANIESYQLLKDRLRIENPHLYQKKYALSQIPPQRDESVHVKHRDVIQFSWTDSILHVHISNKDGIHYFSTKILLPKDIITEYLALDNSTQHVATVNRLLTDSIIQPLQKYIRTDKWIIIPDGDLTYLNLEQIEDGSGNYLLDEVEISYAYSFSQIIQQQSSSKKESNLIGSYAPGFSNQLKQSYLGDSLSEIDSSFLQYLQQPFMLALAADLQQQYEGRAYLDVEATESNLKQNMHRFNILNLGTHGEIDDSNPLYSRIVLAKEALDTVPEDGYLHTYEIYGLNIPADLAILSACETGSGIIKDGEGVISLAHAFQYAGCPSVVMSLWKIDEKSSAIILKHFYTYLAKNWDKSAALRKAKLDYIQDAPQPLKAPYYWAGLVLIGDPNPIDIDGTGYVMWLLALAAMSILCLAWFLASKRSRSGPS